MLSCSKENSETLVRKPAERDAAEQQPTPIRKGHWRNRYWFGEEVIVHPGVSGPGIVIGNTGYPSEAEARNAAAEYLDPTNWLWEDDTHCDEPPVIIYLGPFFTPADGEKQ